LPEHDGDLIGRRGNILALARLCCRHEQVARMLQRRPMADAVEGGDQTLGSAPQRGERAPVSEGDSTGTAPDIRRHRWIVYARYSFDIVKMNLPPGSVPTPEAVVLSFDNVP